MGFDYELWRTNHNICVGKVRRLCELDNSRNYVKCNSTLCVMNNAMQDIQEYFENGKRSSAELCFLIRNIDVVVTGMLDINNLLLGISNKVRRELKEDFDSHRCVWCVNEYKCVCMQTQYDFEI